MREASPRSEQPLPVDRLFAQLWWMLCCMRARLGSACDIPFFAVGKSQISLHMHLTADTTPSGPFVCPVLEEVCGVRAGSGWSGEVPTAHAFNVSGAQCVWWRTGLWFLLSACGTLDFRLREKSKLDYTRVLKSERTVSVTAVFTFSEGDDINLNTAVLTFSEFHGIDVNTALFRKTDEDDPLSAHPSFVLKRDLVRSKKTVE